MDHKHLHDCQYHKTNQLSFPSHQQQLNKPVLEIDTDETFSENLSVMGHHPIHLIWLTSESLAPISYILPHLCEVLHKLSTCSGG